MVCPYGGTTVSKKMTVLITGFEPFENDSYNVSGAIADHLHNAVVAGHPIVGVTLPVVQYDSIRQLKQCIDSYRPSVIVSLGYARISSSLRIERTAINMDDYRIPDTAGNQPIDERIFADAPDAYFASLPIKCITQAIRNAGIPAHVNETAGVYLCNHIFFGGLYYTQNTPIKSGFVHLPPDEKLATTDKTTGDMIPFETQCQAIRILIDTTINTPHDKKISGLGKAWD